MSPQQLLLYSLLWFWHWVLLLSMKGLHFIHINHHYGKSIPSQYTSVYWVYIQQSYHNVIEISNICHCRVDVLIPINTTTTPAPATPIPTTHTDVSLSLVYVPSINLVSSRVSPWLALAIVRAICCSVSWILVVWISDFDRLLGEHTAINYFRYHNVIITLVENVMDSCWKITCTFCSFIAEYLISIEGENSDAPSTMKEG